MKTEESCSDSGGTDEVELVAAVASGEPWSMCGECLDRFAREARVAELR